MPDDAHFWEAVNNVNTRLDRFQETSGKELDTLDRRFSVHESLCGERAKSITARINLMIALISFMIVVELFGWKPAVTAILHLNLP